MREWADRINECQLDQILELGEFLTKVDPCEKPMRMTLIASKLWGEGVARSQEEAYMMLTDACVHAALLPMVEEYDRELKKTHKFTNKVMRMYKALYRQNEALKAKVTKLEKEHADA